MHPSGVLAADSPFALHIKQKGAFISNFQKFSIFALGFKRKPRSVMPRSAYRNVRNSKQMQDTGIMVYAYKRDLYSISAIKVILTTSIREVAYSATLLL